MGDTTCAAAGCANKPIRQGRGFCHAHYLAGLEDGSIPRLKKSRFADRPTECSVESCSKKSRTRGYCGTHYQRWRLHGDPNFVTQHVRATCVEGGCERPAHAGGLCTMHLSRVRRRGSSADRPKKPPIERFLENVDTSAGPDACHLWTGRRTLDGYGRFNTGGKEFKATRWILGHHRGTPLDGQEWALHHCDNPPCMNLRHIYIGDVLQNNRDRVARGRSGKKPPRTRCPNGHKYTPETVREGKGTHKCLICHRERQNRKNDQRRAAYKSLKSARLAEVA